MTLALKSRLRDGEKLAGCWSQTYHPVAAEIMAAVGYDVCMIDLEHGPGSYIDAQAILPALEKHGCAPVIRVPFAHPAEIKKAMDLGVAGIMIPNLVDANEARDMVAATRYGPAGIRGAAPGIIRATGYGSKIQTYARDLAREFLLIGQIESRQAVGQIDEIADVEGLDMLFVGPSDLSASLGEMGNFSSDEFLTAIEQIESAAKENNKLLGAIPLPTRSAAELYASGHQLVVSGMDTMMLQAAAQDDLAGLKEAMG